MALTLENFDVERMVFGDPKKVQVSSNNFSFCRIPVQYRYPDDFEEEMLRNTTTSLHLKTPKLFSYGVQGKYDKILEAGGKVPDGAKLTGYQVALTMHSRDAEATKEERDMVELLDVILAKVQSHLRKESTRTACEKRRIAVDEMTLLYRKCDKGKQVAGVPPVLYTQLYSYQDRNEPGKFSVKTDFVDDKAKSIPFEKLMGVRCQMECDVVVDHIFVGAVAKIQTRLNGAIVYVAEEPRISILLTNKRKAVEAASAQYDGDNDDNEYNEEDEDNESCMKYVRRSE